MTRLGSEKVDQRASVEEVELEQAQHVLERDAQGQLEPQEGQDEVDNQRHPDLGHDRVFRGAQEGLDLQVLCNGCEKERDLPALLVNRRNRGGPQVEGIGPEHVMFPGFGVPIPHPPQHGGIGGGFRPLQHHVLVRGPAALPVHLKALRHLVPGVDLLTGDEVDPVVGQAEQKAIVHGPPVHGDDAALWQLQPPGDGTITALALAEHHKGGEVARMVEQGMQLDGAFGAAAVRPGAQAQAEGDGGAVPGKKGAFEAEAMPRGHGLAAGVERAKEGLIQGRWPPLVGLRQGGALGGRQAERREGLGLGGEGADHIPQAGAPRQLGEDQGAELAPATEHPAGPSSAMRGIQGLDLCSRDPFQHLGQKCGTLGHGSNPPAGGMWWRFSDFTNRRGASSLLFSRLSRTAMENAAILTSAISR